jgi:prevent-host-death family protein
VFRMTARDFNQSVARAQRIADEEPVLVTRRGEPAYVLLNIDEYQRLRSESPAGDDRSLLDVIAPVPTSADPDDVFGRIMDDLASERARDLGREVDL